MPIARIAEVRGIAKGLDGTGRADAAFGRHVVRGIAPHDLRQVVPIDEGVAAGALRQRRMRAEQALPERRRCFTPGPRRREIERQVHTIRRKHG